MFYQFLILLIPFSICTIKLYVDDIYRLEDNYHKNNISIILNIRRLNTFDELIVNDIFKINLESENVKEKNKKITFLCGLFSLPNANNTQIKCLLKEANIPNLKGPFYLRQENFKKSFIIHFNGEILKFSIEMLEEVFYIGMIKSFRTKKCLFNIEFNYRVSDIIIPISMALNDEYTYPTIVAITSILENANSNTKYDFYILHTHNYSSENKIKLKYFEKKYYKCSITLINMENSMFQNASLSRHITTIAAYFRLSLPDLLPNVDKIIYLDGDTITFDDLKEMFDINMDEYYIKGFLDVGNDNLLPNNDKYICSGVILINLENLRKNDIVNKMYNFMIKNNNKLHRHDQTIINGVCYEKIGILPAKFGIFNYDNLNILYNQTNIYYKNKKYRYSENELMNAFYHPIILHAIFKPWIRSNKYTKTAWLKYAKKTNYYKEICNKYKICNENKKFIVIKSYFIKKIISLSKIFKNLFHKIKNKIKKKM